MNSLKIIGNEREDAILELMNSEESKYQLIFKSDTGAFKIKNNHVEILEVTPN